eukprot:GHUV01032657.1.p1 GENE.GHUV01032657.1~~GHUV01032657.1.p1  ORF type:complete len:143 (-),score=49.82 GHUV01032657.1:39-467(-)
MALLGSSNEGVQTHAAGVLWNLALDSGNCSAIAALPQSISRLVALLSSDSEDLQNLAAGLLWKLADESANRASIAAVPQGIDRLVALLSSNNQSVKRDAARVLLDLTVPTVQLFPRLSTGWKHCRPATPTVYEHRQQAHWGA